MASYWSVFLDWQNYVHYILNVLFLFAEVLPFKLYNQNIFLMFFTLTGLLFLNDSIIHFMFYYLPKPIQWRS